MARLAGADSGGVMTAGGVTSFLLICQKYTPIYRSTLTSTSSMMRSMAVSTAPHPCWHSEASDGAKMALFSAMADDYELSDRSSAKRAKFGV